MTLCEFFSGTSSETDDFKRNFLLLVWGRKNFLNKKF